MGGDPSLCLNKHSRGLQSTAQISRLQTLDTNGPDTVLPFRFPGRSSGLCSTGRGTKDLYYNSQGLHGQMLLESAAPASHTPSIPCTCRWKQRPLGLAVGVFHSFPSRTQSAICPTEDCPCCTLETACLDQCFS